MKYLAFSLLAALCAISCDEPQKEALTSQSRVDAPYHPEIEFCLLRAPRAGGVGVMNTELWANGEIGTSFTIEEPGEATNQMTYKYGMKTEYRGSARSEQIDFHFITIEVPDSESVAMEVGFDGSEQEIWKDKRLYAVIRAHTKK